MKIKDKNLKKQVDVSCPDCASFKCYWPRPHPGVFNQGSGYSGAEEAFKKYGYICGTREIRGCPDERIKVDKNGN